MVVGLLSKAVFQRLSATSLEAQKVIGAHRPHRAHGAHGPIQGPPGLVYKLLCLSVGGSAANTSSEMVPSVLGQVSIIWGISRPILDMHP